MSTPSQPNPLPEPAPQLDLAAHWVATGAEIRAGVVQEGLSLPLYRELRKAQIARVAEHVK